MKMLYHIVKGTTSEELTERVTRLMRSGWKCQGGVSFSWGPQQAMIRPARRRKRKAVGK